MSTSSKILIVLFIIAFQATNLFSQIATTFHQSFTIDEDIPLIVIDLDYPVQIEEWNGNTILIETNVQLSNTSKQILDYYIKDGRYKIEQKDYIAAVEYGHKKMVRKAIYTQNGPCKEDVLVKIYTPRNKTVNVTNSTAMAE